MWLGLISGGDNAAGVADGLDWSQSAGPVVVDLDAGRFVGIETVIGNNVDSTLSGADAPNTWIITGENNGSLNGLQFVDFNNLTGGAGVDTFEFTTDDEPILDYRRRRTGGHRFPRGQADPWGEAVPPVLWRTVDHRERAGPGDRSAAGGRSDGDHGDRAAGQCQTKRPRRTGITAFS